MPTAAEDRLRKALEEAVAVLEGLVADDVAEGNRNSHVAQIARPAARRAREALAEPKAKPGPYSG